MPPQSRNNVVLVPRFSESVTELLRGLSAGARLARRRRLYALIDSTAERLIAARGAAGARAECVRRMAFCARAARGLRWTIWRRVYSEIKRKSRL